MRPSSSITELASKIGRTLISSSNNVIPTRTWNVSLEHSLHKLNIRNSLTPQLVSQVINSFLLTHHSLSLGFFNWASQQPDFTHNPLTYNSILKSLFTSKEVNAVDSLLKTVRAEKFVLDGSVYGDLIAFYVRNRKTHYGFLMYCEIRKMGFNVESKVCNLLLASLACDGYWGNAIKVFDEMIVRGVCFSNVGFGVFLWRVCGNWDLKKVLEMIDEVKKGVSRVDGSVIASLVVHGLCRTSRVVEAFDVLDELRIRGWKPDFLAYRIVAETFGEMGNIVEREKVLKMKRKLGVEPRSNEYKEFIFDLISDRRTHEAKELGEAIVSGDFPVDDDVLNALIGTVSADELDSALTFLKLMIRKGRFPTLLTLSNLCRNICKHGRNDDLLEIHQILASNGYFSNVETYKVMVSFLCKGGKVKEAYGALQDMKKEGLIPDVSLYNSLMEACCREDLRRPAKRLWDEMFSSGCSGDLRTYTILIKKFSGIGQVEEANMLFHHMLERGIAPDSCVYESLIEGLCRESKFEDAQKIFSHCYEKDGPLAESVLRTYIPSLCFRGQFVAALKAIQSFTCDMGNIGAHVTFIKSLVEAKEVVIALEHIKWVQRTSPSMLRHIPSDAVAAISSNSAVERILPNDLSTSV